MVCTQAACSNPTCLDRVMMVNGRWKPHHCYKKFNGSPTATLASTVCLVCICISFLRSHTSIVAMFYNPTTVPTTVRHDITAFSTRTLPRLARRMLLNAEPSVDQATSCSQHCSAKFSKNSLQHKHILNGLPRLSRLSGTTFQHCPPPTSPANPHHLRSGPQPALS